MVDLLRHNVLNLFLGLIGEKNEIRVSLQVMLLLTVVSQRVGVCVALIFNILSFFPSWSNNSLAAQCK